MDISATFTRDISLQNLATSWWPNRKRKATIICIKSSGTLFKILNQPIHMINIQQREAILTVFLTTVYCFSPIWSVTGKGLAGLIMKLLQLSLHISVFFLTFFWWHKKAFKIQNFTCLNSQWKCSAYLQQAGWKHPLCCWVSLLSWKTSIGAVWWHFSIHSCRVLE